MLGWPCNFYLATDLGKTVYNQVQRFSFLVTLYCFVLEYALLIFIFQSRFLHLVRFGGNAIWVEVPDKDP